MLLVFVGVVFVVVGGVGVNCCCGMVWVHAALAGLRSVGGSAVGVWWWWR